MANTSNQASIAPNPLGNSAETPEIYIVNIISLEGDVLYVAATSEFTVEKIKSIAIEHFYGNDKEKSLIQYRLIHTNLLKRLNDNNSLKDEEIHETDELLIVPYKVPEVKQDSEVESSRPSAEDIHEATKNLPIKNPKKSAVTSDCLANFSDEMQKVFITLAQASAKIISNTPEAYEFLEILRGKIARQIKRQMNPDPNTVKHLVEIGFPEKLVLVALRLKKMNTSEALEWLLAHKDDPGVKDVEYPTLESVLENQGVSTFPENSKDNINLDITKVIDKMLETFRKQQRLTFKPDLNLIQNLENMGFEKSDIIEALYITGNNQSNACEWLIGGRKPELEILKTGIETESPIYEAIMNNPCIQLSLTNAKFLHAYLSMIESPMTTNIWLKDTDTSPVLNQIFKTYHSEKHALHMNRCIE